MATTSQKVSVFEKIGYSLGALVAWNLVLYGYIAKESAVVGQEIIRIKQRTV